MSFEPYGDEGPGLGFRYIDDDGDCIRVAQYEEDRDLTWIDVSSRAGVILTPAKVDDLISTLLEIRRNMAKEN